MSSQVILNLCVSVELWKTRGIHPENLSIQCCFWKAANPWERKPWAPSPRCLARQPDICIFQLVLFQNKEQVPCALTLKCPWWCMPRDRHCSIEMEASYRGTNWHAQGREWGHTKRWSSVSASEQVLADMVSEEYARVQHQLPRARIQNPVHNVSLA